jgi:site-specific DNA-methyltransferase (cytosine-N4-specific)
MGRPTPSYSTSAGDAYHGDSREVLATLADASVDLCFTSPPFPLQRQKAYGNVTADNYIEWIMPVVEQVHRVLTNGGSFVIEIGSGWNPGSPTISTLPWELGLRLTQLFRLAQKYPWFNTRSLPSPTEWVCKQRVRCKEAVTELLWFGKCAQPYADNRAVLTPYVRANRPRRAAHHPSGHKITPHTWHNGNGGAIPPNCFTRPGVAGDDYMRRCKAAGHVVHPARQPPEFADFFIRMCTRPGALVLDPFAGSNTTGQVAEQLGRRWLSIEIQREYVAASRLRFTGEQAQKVAP